MNDVFSLSSLKYVLITAAKNEDEFIERTITAVIEQTCTPLKWIIVDDGSTDGTREIIKKYAEQVSWIELLPLSRTTMRSFANKAYAFNAGYDRIRDLNFEVVGNLDADLEFEGDYFEYLLTKFREFPDLGVAGTAFLEDGQSYDYEYTNIEHVSGMCQLFRRSCFEEIGGYQPLEGGGIDWLAVIMARMNGWRTRTFLGKYFIHRRSQGSAGGGLLSGRFRDGKKDYLLGVHPIWEMFRVPYQMTRSPYLIGGLCLFAGYISGLLCRVKREIPDKVIQFRRKEEMGRLWKVLFPNSSRM